ncbi:MAG: GNAT family N-acetyltransferase [Eubacteriales bacterium]
MTLTTKRLVLRPFTREDFAAVHSYASDPDNTKYMYWGPNSEDATRDFLDNCIERSKLSPRKDYDFAVTRKESGKVIGSCGIYLEDGRDEASLGYILHKDYWCRGYGGELASELIRFGFEELKVHRIYATCDARNYGSYHVMEKNGMRREGCFLKCRQSMGQWADELHYAILDEEWLARCDGTRLVECSEKDGYDIYEMLQEIPPGENGFMNGVYGKSYSEFKDWLRMSVKHSQGQELSEGHVPGTCYWFYKGLRPVGFAKLRHRLTPSLLVTGGHIGYCIRPSQRGRGYGSEMLSHVLGEASRLGIESVLLTINEVNRPSARIAEKNGGVLEKTENAVRYYRIATK